jgi:hypothetical protein
MAEDMAKLWENFHLTEEESVVVAVHEENLEDYNLRGQACLVGKLIAERIVGKDTIRKSIVRWWKPTGSLSFRVLGENLFLIEFENSWDKSRVLEGRPWSFEGNLFSVADFDGITPPSHMDFNTEGFWVRMFNLPLACMGKETGLSLGATVGIVEEVETDIDGFGWGEFLRVKIRINLMKPLARGRMLKLKDQTTWIKFQYEHIPQFCFRCGVICHGSTGCTKPKPRRSFGSETQFEYGPWLRVPKFRRWTEPRHEGGAAGVPAKGDWGEQGSGGESFSSWRIPVLSGKAKEVHSPPESQPITGVWEHMLRGAGGPVTDGGRLEDVGGHVGAFHASHETPDVEQLARDSRHAFLEQDMAAFTGARGLMGEVSPHAVSVPKQTAHDVPRGLDVEPFLRSSRSTSVTHDGGLDVEPCLHLPRSCEVKQALLPQPAVMVERGAKLSVSIC